MIFSFYIKRIYPKTVDIIVIDILDWTYSDNFFYLIGFTDLNSIQ